MSESAWDESVLAELIGLHDTATLVITDGVGRTLKRYARSDARADLAEIADVGLAGIVRAGTELALGDPRLIAASFTNGMLVGAVTTDLRAVIVGLPDANLGRMLLLLRHLFPERP